MTNHYKLTVGPQCPQLTKHLVEIGPADGPATSATNEPPLKLDYEVKEEIMRKALEQIPNVKSEMVVWDGDRIMYYIDRLNFTGIVKLGRSKGYSVSISGQNAPMDMKKLLEDPSPEMHTEFNQCMDIIMKQAAKVRCHPLNRRIMLHQHGDCMLDLAGYNGRNLPALRPTQQWMGHQQVMEISQEPAGLEATLIVNTAGSTALEEMPVLKYLELKMGKKIEQLPPDKKTGDYVFCELKGLKLLQTQFNPPRKCKAGAVVPLTAQQHKFEYEKGDISVEQYFAEKYKFKLKHPRAMMVQKAPLSAEAYLPLECLVVARQTLRTQISDIMKSVVTDIMIQDPGTRLKYIQKAVQQVYGSNNVLKDFGLTLNREAMSVTGRILHPPRLRYAVPGSEGRFQTVNVSQGKWNMMGNAFCSARPLKAWGVLNCSRCRLQEVTGMLQDMFSFGERLNMRRPPAPKLEKDVRFERLAEAADGVRQWATEGKRLDLLFVIIPEKDADLHREVKYLFDGLCPTQCLVSRNTPTLNGKEKGKDGHFANILSKVNLKLAGTNQMMDPNQAVMDAVRAFIGNDNRTVVISCAFQHANAASLTRGEARDQLPTFVAMLANVDPDCTWYAHALQAQMTERDTITQPGRIIEDVLKRRKVFYHRKFGKELEPPLRVIYLRDGCGDYSHGEIFKTELRDLDLVFQKNGWEKPQVLAVAIRRAHQTRFFPTHAGDDRTNMPPGLVVFDNLSMPTIFPNFYLLSHAGIKGTSHPARYVVLKDDFRQNDPKLKGKSDKDILEYYAHFIYQLCHLYGSCQRAVSMPAPIYNANKLVERARELVNRKLIEKFYGINLVKPRDPTAFVGAKDQIGQNEQQDICDIINQRFDEVADAMKPAFYN